MNRLLFVCFILACFTTFLALQQTQQLRLQHDVILSRAYRQYPIGSKKTNFWKTNDSVPRNIINPMSITQDELIKQYYEETLASEPFKSLSLKQNRSMFADNYVLLPVLYYNMGPNNLFRIFRESIVIAYMMKRSLVVPTFHHHPRMKRLEEDNLNSKKKMKVDIFDQTYEAKMETNSNKTFDMIALDQLLPIFTMKKFQRQCEGRLDYLITCGDLKEKRQLGFKQFKKISKVSVSHTYAVKNFRNLFGKRKQIQFESAIHKTKESKCVGLALGSRCLGNRKSWFDHWKNFSPFVRRPPAVKILAKHFIAEVFASQPFLAVHWRYESEDWQDMCKASRPDPVRKINQPMCDMAKQLSTNISLLSSIAESLNSYARNKEMKYVYFASPPQLVPFAKLLQSQVSNLFIISDVLKFSRSHSLISDVFDDNFSASFLEQELCYLASHFLGSPLSSWTQTVMMDRYSEDKDNANSVLDVAIKDHYGFPELTWYFPEGD